MVKYRPLNNDISESISECAEFNTVASMLRYIESKWDGIVDCRDIVIGESFGEDGRTGWKSCRYVRITKSKCYFENADGTRTEGKVVYRSPQSIGICDLGEFG